MALFRINVDLHLYRETREGLMRLVQATERQATALEAILAKLNEDDSPEAVTVEFNVGPVREQPLTTKEGA